MSATKQDYLKLDKEELAEMLVTCNRVRDGKVEGITRFEVIDQQGRKYVNTDCEIDLSFQNEALKVFVNNWDKYECIRIFTDVWTRLLEAYRDDWRFCVFSTLERTVMSESTTDWYKRLYRNIWDRSGIKENSLIHLVSEIADGYVIPFDMRKQAIECFLKEFDDEEVKEYVIKNSLI